MAALLLAAVHSTGVQPRVALSANHLLAVEPGRPRMRPQSGVDIAGTTNFTNMIKHVSNFSLKHLETSLQHMCENSFNQ